MRSCRQCRAPLENSAASCPACGVFQEGGPRVNPEPTSRAPRWLLVKAFADLFDLFGLSPLLVVLLLAAYLAIGGVIGYFIGGETGVVVGVLAMIVLLFGAMAWSDLRR